MLEQIGKMVLIWGPPKSGKSTLVASLCQKAMENKEKKIALVSCCDKVPVYPFLWHKTSEFTSLYALLSSPDLSEELIFSSMNVGKEEKNLAVFGSCSGTRKEDYPLPTKKKLDQFFELLIHHFDLVLVDGVFDFEQNPLSMTALKKCHKVLCPIPPAMQDVRYFDSMKEPLKKIGFSFEKMFPLYSFPRADILDMRDEFLKEYTMPPYFLPYYACLASAYFRGGLFETKVPKTYAKVCGHLLEEVMEE